MKVKIKQYLAHVLFYIGDKVSYLVDYEWLSPVSYPVYSRLMLWSSELDINGEIWKSESKNR